MSIRFDGRVAIVTGGGGALGRAYALGFASRGAKVVVNDLGTALNSEGSASSSLADKVVAEIRAVGGEAIANYDSVSDGAKIVQAALDAFGRIDILVNNAGNLRDVSFRKMTERDWNLVYDVHLNGYYQVTRAAWPHMRKQKYGRIIMASSRSGTNGNFGQANYSSMKMGIVGLANTLAIEGKKHNVLVNVLVPTAGSRMTETVWSADKVKEFDPSYVAPIVLYLCSENNKTETGSQFEARRGIFRKVRWERTKGMLIHPSKLSIEEVAKNFDKICDFHESTNPRGMGGTIGIILSGLKEISKKSKL